LTAHTNNIWSSRLDELIQEYRIDTTSTVPLAILGLKPTTHVFKVVRSDFDTDTFKTYIIETEEMNNVIARPSLVGSKLMDECIDAALEAVKVMFWLTEIKDFWPGRVVYYGLDRAGPYYGRRTALNIKNGEKIRSVSTRPKYTVDLSQSYDHTERVVNVAGGTADFEGLQQNEHLYVVTDDTGASGKTYKAAIPPLVEECEKVGSVVEFLDVYGMNSCVAVKILKELDERYNIKMNVFCIWGVTDLDIHDYNMPPYGYKDRGGNGRGSIVDMSTLYRMIQRYGRAQNIDAAWDWSDRHINIEKHLDHSSGELCKSLANGSYEGWEVQLAEAELERIKDSLLRYGTNKNS